jgi:hypothetical protein
MDISCIVEYAISFLKSTCTSKLKVEKIKISVHSTKRNLKSLKKKFNLKSPIQAVFNNKLLKKIEKPEEAST